MNKIGEQHFPLGFHYLVCTTLPLKVSDIPTWLVQNETKISHLVDVQQIFRRYYMLSPGSFAHAYKDTHTGVLL